MNKFKKFISTKFDFITNFYLKDLVNFNNMVIEKNKAIFLEYLM